MASLTVLEHIRSHDSVWNLPAEPFDALRRAFPDVRFVSPSDASERERALAEADVVFGWAVTPKNFATATRLRWVQVTAAGVGPMLFPAFIESDVILTNGRGLHSLAMAEHTLGVILAFARKLHLARDRQHARRWDQDGLWVGMPGFANIEGSTLGLIGFGSVGVAIATRARALGMRVLAVRRHPASDPAPADAQWGMEQLGNLLVASDWVVLSPPLTAETRGMIDTAALARMKRGAVLVNLGRGALVDEPALVAALLDGGIAGAALDVFAEEPLPAESPLWSMPQVIVTPHISGLGPDYWERAVALFGRNLAHFVRGEPLENVVDKRAGY